MVKILKFIYWFFLKKRNFSQANEEKIISELFKKKPKGFYIDVGCYNPRKYSNTALLYKKGWTGINIDAEKKNLKWFKIFRKRDINLNFFISNKKTKGTIAKNPTKNLTALKVKGPMSSIPVSCAINVVPQIKVHNKALSNETVFDIIFI